jgi:hypothetical protein
MAVKLKKGFLLFSVMLLLFTVTGISAKRPADDPWKAEQLMEPQVLVNIIKANKGDLPVILNVGSVNDIKGAKAVGPDSTPEGMALLKSELKNIPKDKLVVIYCGCCPLFKCPNVRPAFRLLAAEGYTNIRVLNLKTNLQTDWVDKKYPMDEGE